MHTTFLCIADPGISLISSWVGKHHSEDATSIDEVSHGAHSIQIGSPLRSILEQCAQLDGAPASSICWLGKIKQGMSKKKEKTGPCLSLRKSIASLVFEVSKMIGDV
jgi:hypothetical protein